MYVDNSGKAVKYGHIEEMGQEHIFSYLYHGFPISIRFYVWKRAEENLACNRKCRRTRIIVRCTAC